MAYDIATAFDEFIAEIRTSRAELAAAAGHRSTIEAKLRQEFGMTAFFRTGSFGAGTSIYDFSDVDYFAVIPNANLKADSASTLSAMAEALRLRFPQTPNIRVNGPAVQLPFGLDGAEHTEVIPVDATGTTLLGFRQFDMPDGNGGWKFSAPESHKSFVDAHDERLGFKLKPLIRFLKAWKFYRGVPVRSFYLEMFVTACMVHENAIVYSIDVSNILSRLARHGFQDIVDPRFADMTISGCSTPLLRMEAIGQAANAAQWANEAWAAENRGRIADAFARWDLVFNGSFPSYRPLMGLGAVGR